MSESVDQSIVPVHTVVEIFEKKLSFKDATAKARTSYNLGLPSSVEFRQKQLKNLSRMYKEQESAMLQALNKDLGKSIFEALLFEINFLKNDVINVRKYFKTWIKPRNSYKRLMDFFGRPQIYHDAYGVVFIVGAWNYPLQSTLLPLASAIAAGNCVVIQPPQLAGHTTQFITDTLNKYIDNSCYLVSNEQVIDLDIDYLFFTGTLKEAKRLQSMCSKSLIPATFIVGSQNPVYIDDSADIHLTAQRVMWGKCVNAGQTCIAPGYILCTKEVMTRFIREVPGVISSFYGNPKVSTDYSRIISEEHFDRLVSFLKGKDIAYGGDYDRSTLYFEPTVLANVTPNYALLYDEIYGPILPIVVMQNVEEVVTFLNARGKPLAFYIFSNNKQVVESLITRTSSGGVTVNDVFMHFAADSLPFGGVGESGFGCYHGKKTFDAFVHQKSVLKKPLNSFVEQVERLRYPPYSDRKQYLLTQLSKKQPFEIINVRYLKYIFVFLCGMVITFIISGM